MVSAIHQHESATGIHVSSLEPRSTLIGAYVKGFMVHFSMKLAFKLMLYVKTVKKSLN